MVRITKLEAITLNKLGVPFHENGISTDHSGHGHYWLCMNPKNQGLLNQIRDERLRGMK